MATGISMSSVNKIKELAENGEYGLALDILENQDLSRSLSPQFIRVCGEVYYENHKYHEARAALVRAHSMAPAGNKIIFSLIQLYLTMGLRTLADKYYEVYKFNLEGREDVGKIRLEYLFAKADRKPVSELHAILVSANDKEKAEQWEYEHLLILAALKEQEKLKYEGEVFKATYKKSVYMDRVNELLAGTSDVLKELYCFPSSEAADNAVEDEDTRKMEEKVLEADDYRLNPTAPTITLMVENDEPVSSAMKIKQTLARNKAKREEKKEKKKLAKAEAEGNADDTDGESRETASDKHEKKGFFKRRMSKQEEEEIIEALAGIKESNDDNTTLLNKIMDEEEAETGNDNNNSESDIDEKTQTVHDETGEKTEPVESPETTESAEAIETTETAEGTDNVATTEKTTENDEPADTAETADVVETSGEDEVPETPVRKSIVLESVKIKPDISDIKITTSDDDLSDDFDPMFDEDDLDDQINSIIESEINGDRDSLAYNDVVREVEQQEIERKRRHDERVSSDMGLDKDKDSMISNMELTEDSMSYTKGASSDSSDVEVPSPEQITYDTGYSGSEATVSGDRTDISDVEENTDQENAGVEKETETKENVEIKDDSDDETEGFDFISVDEDEDVSFAENVDDDMVTIDHSQIPESVEEIKIEDLSESEEVKIVDLMDTLTDINETSVDIAEETVEPEVESEQEEMAEAEAEPEPEEVTETEVEPEPEEVAEPEVEPEPEPEESVVEPVIENEIAETVEENTSVEETEVEETVTVEPEMTTEPEPEEAAEPEIETEQEEAEVEPVIEDEITETVEENTSVGETEVEEAVTAEPEIATETEQEEAAETEAETEAELDPEEITTPDELDQMLREIEMISRENEKIVKEYEDTAKAEEIQQVEEEEPEPVKYGFQSDKLVGDEGYEFPVFRSELFPEYNSDDKNGGNKVFNPDDIKLEDQEKIDEHLAEEEALLKETDELLARLGIELGTKYYSGTDYFTKEQFEEDHEAVKKMDASINQKQDKKTKEDNSRFKLR